MEGRTLLSLFQSVTDYGGMEGISSVAVGEFNHDWISDIVAASNSGVTLLPGRGDGTFGPSSLFPIGTSPQSGSNPTAIAVATSTAMVTSTSSRPITGAATSACCWRRHGSFQAAENVAIGNRQIRHQSRAALGGPRRSHGQWHTRHRHGELLRRHRERPDGQWDGSFRPAVSFPVGSQPDSVAVADLNHNGKLDIVVADKGSRAVTILQNNGQGSFTTLATYRVGLAPTSVAVGDLYGNGRLDIVTANSGK